MAQIAVLYIILAFICFFQMSNYNIYIIFDKSSFAELVLK